MSTATLDSPPATGTHDAVDPQRERLAFERFAAIKRAATAARRLRAEADALKVKLADATRARDEALAAVRLAEAKVQDAALMHGRTREVAERQLRATAPKEIAECRAELEQIRKELCDRDPRGPEQYAAAQRQVKAIFKARDRLAELELEALAAVRLAARIQQIREDVEAAGRTDD